MWLKKRWSAIWERCFYRQWKMSKLDQNFPKMLWIFCHRPPEQIVIPLPPGILIRHVPYPIGCSLGIILSGLQGRQRWRGLGRGGYLDQYLITGRLKKRTRMEGNGCMDDCLGGRWDVTLYFSFIVSFGCSIPGSTTEGRKLKGIYIVLLKV